jgi:hypothetical protein
MRLKFALAAFALGWAGAWPALAEARTRPPPIRNQALLNIGFVCRWQSHCITRQQREMERALKYVRKKEPPAWKIQLCNRNSSRNGTRKDWEGFNNCIRNASLRPPPKARRRSG